MKSSIDIFSLQGKQALITGATGYLGRAMAFALAEAGVHVLINSRSKIRADTLTQELLDCKLSAESACFDVTSAKAIEYFFSSRDPQPLNILINNAYAGGAGNIESSSPDHYKKSYDVTVVATHNLFKLALPSVRKAVETSGDASIINIGSMYGIVSPHQTLYDTPETTNPPFYGAAKAALLQWTRYAACEFGKENIRINAVSPGAFPSTSVQENDPEFIERLGKKIPMARIGQAEEIKGIILFLASSASSYVNGANINIDGGWTAW